MATLQEDIPVAPEWIIQCFSTLPKELDYSIESLKEIDDFIDEQTENGQPKSGSILETGLGKILFGIASYVGETLIKNNSGSVWVTDDKDPQGEVNIAIQFKRGALIWPMQRVMKRFKNGKENSTYHYGLVITQQEAK